MKRPKVTGLRRRESWQALPFLLPSLLGLCLFYLFPLAETVRASFMDPLRSRAVGWGNYRALFQNTAFRLAVRNTCRFLCICIPALLAVSLLCAVLLGAAKRRAVFFKSVLLLPYAIPVASIVVLWRALFSGKGLVNGLLVGLGCRPVDFMGSSAAFWVLIFTYLWRNNGYDILYWETARSLWTQYLKAIPGKEEKVKRAIRGILADYEKEERDIIYLESKNHCVLVHLDGIRQTPEGSPSFYATLDEAEHEFASSAFLRIHKSYLINGDHILQMSNYKVLLDTGMTLKGSRKYFSKAKLEFYRGR